ncbi:MAG TPA: hypothetical protein VII62_18000, partial [Vicinamibacteria bacterium]
MTRKASRPDASDRLEITPLSLYLRRREFMALGAGSAVGASLLRRDALAAPAELPALAGVKP